MAHIKIIIKVGAEMGGSGENTSGCGSPLDLNLTFYGSEAGRKSWLLPVL